MIKKIIISIFVLSTITTESNMISVLNTIEYIQNNYKEHETSISSCNFVMVKISKGQNFNRLSNKILSFENIINNNLSFYENINFCTLNNADINIRKRKSIIFTYSDSSPPLKNI